MENSDRDSEGGGGTSILPGQAQMLYGILGPALTRHLLCLLDEASDSGFQLTRELEELRTELSSEEGSRPWMLMQLGIALGAVAVHGDLNVLGLTGEVLAHQAHERVSEIVKNAGWFIEQRLMSFGFDRASFALHAVLLDAGPTWPGDEPPGGAVLPEPPSMRPDWDWSGPHGSFAFLEGDRPSLLGAHLVELGKLRRYVELCETALANSPEDLRDLAWIDPSDESRIGRELDVLTGAVAQIRAAWESICEAQGAICSVFPT